MCPGQWWWWWEQVCCKAPALFMWKFVKEPERAPGEIQENSKVGCYYITGLDLLLLIKDPFPEVTRAILLPQWTHIIDCEGLGQIASPWESQRERAHQGELGTLQEKSALTVMWHPAWPRCSPKCSTNTASFGSFSGAVSTAEARGDGTYLKSADYCW